MVVFLIVDLVVPLEGRLGVEGEIALKRLEGSALEELEEVTLE